MKKPRARTVLALGAGIVVFIGWTSVDAPVARSEGPPAPNVVKVVSEPTQPPAAAPVPFAGAVGTAIVSGTASTYGPGYDGYLALPEGPGIRVKVCGDGGCVTRTSNDAGPDLAMQRLGRIVDLDVADFERTDSEGNE